MPGEKQETISTINNFLHSTSSLAGKFWRNGVEYPYRRIEDTPLGSAIRGAGYAAISPLTVIDKLAYGWGQMKKGYWHLIHNANVPSASIDIPIPGKDYALHFESSQIRLDDVMMSYPFIASSLAVGFAASAASVAVAETPAAPAALPLSIGGAVAITVGSWSLEERQKFKNFMRFQQVLDTHFKAAKAADIPVSDFPIGQLDEHGNLKMPTRNKADYVLNLSKVAANGLSNGLVLLSPVGGFPLVVTALTIKGACVGIEAARISTRTWSMSKQERDISGLAQTLSNEADLLLMCESIKALQKENEDKPAKYPENLNKIAKLLKSSNDIIDSIIADPNTTDKRKQSLMSIRANGDMDQRISTLKDIVKETSTELKDQYIAELKDVISRDVIKHSKPHMSERHRLKLEDRIAQNLAILENFGEEKPDPISIAREHLERQPIVNRNKKESNTKTKRQYDRLKDSQWIPLTTKPIGGIQFTDSLEDITNSIHAAMDDRERTLQAAGKVQLPTQLYRLHSHLFESTDRIYNAVDTFEKTKALDTKKKCLTEIQVDAESVANLRDNTVRFLKEKITDLYHRYDHAEAKADKFKYYKKAEKFSKVLGELGVKNCSVREVANEIEKRRIDQGLDQVQVERKPHHHWQARVNTRERHAETSEHDSQKKKSTWVGTLKQIVERVSLKR